MTRCIKKFSLLYPELPSLSHPVALEFAGGTIYQARAFVGD